MPNYTGYIYKISNKINGKSYIGKTSNLLRRWKQHKSGRGNTSILKKALIKYGIDNFDFVKLAEIKKDSIIELNSSLSLLEMCYINAYDSYSHGYNATIGGDGACGFKPSMETRHKMSIAKKGKPLSIKRILAYKTIAENRRGISMDRDAVIRGAIKRRKPILQYNLKGDFVAEHPGSSLISSTYANANIIACCKGKLNSAYGYIWKYKNGKVEPHINVNADNKVHISNRPIIQLSEDNVIINEFKSATKASIITGISRKAISNCLSGRSKTSGGFIWKYKDINYE